MSVRACLAVHFGHCSFSEPVCVGASAIGLGLRTGSTSMPSGGFGIGRNCGRESCPGATFNSVQWTSPTEQASGQAIQPLYPLPNFAATYAEGPRRRRLKRSG